MVPIFKTKLVVHLFIKTFTITIVKRKLIIRKIILSQLLVMLNKKSTVKLLISYKGVLASTLKNKAQQEIFYLLLAQQPLQIMEEKNKCQR